MAYTLQLLHFADGEAGTLAPSTAPYLAALVDAFEDDYVNSITLAGGDNWLPGPFLAAGTDPSLASLVPGNSNPGRVDISIHNAIGVQASALGNHEFDLGSNVFQAQITPGGGYAGALFPYITANLDFSGDSALGSRFTQTVGVGGLEEASSLNGRIAPSAVITENGERIGIVGVTTQLIEQISSPSGTEVLGFPTGPGANGEVDNMVLLAAQLQPVINDLVSQGVNKIVLLSHLQLIGNEELLATLITGVDIIVAAGSNTRLGDADDVAVAFPGHAADFADTYPIITAGADGKTSVIVNTDNEYTYLGRLVVEFDNNGEIITQSLTDNVAINGAYASTEDNVADAWGVTETDNLSVQTVGGTTTAAVLSAATAGNIYINLHSTAFPGGEVRGQLALVSDTRVGGTGPGVVTFTSVLNGANEVPAVATDAEGRALVRFTVASDGTVTYNSDITVGGFDVDRLTVGHFHEAPAGSNGGVVENLLTDAGTTVTGSFGYYFDDNAFAEGSRGETVEDFTDAVQAVITVKDGNVYGYSNVYLEGERGQVRTQETNLGNISADANGDAARVALGLADDAFLVSIKNGGGIRAQIGTISAPDPVTGLVTRLPSENGEVSQLDAENALRFNNRLMVFDTTAQGLLNILNTPSATTANSGGFIQIGGVRFSFDPTRPAGSRVQDVVLVDEDGATIAVIAENGVVNPNGPSSITVSVLNFTANGGDGYLIKPNGTNFRFLLDDGTVSAPVNPALNFTAAGVVPANALGEIAAFENYLRSNFGTPETAFNEADTPAALDTRIQNEAVRVSDLFDGQYLGTALADTLVGTTADDIMDGGARNDVISAGVGNDTISGGGGNDIIDGGEGNDFIRGESGNDELFGGTGNDNINGGSGNDIIEGGFGGDRLRGGAGTDTYIYETVADSSIMGGVDFVTYGLDDIFDLSAIDADAAAEGNQAFTLVDAFTGTAGELTMSNLGTADRMFILGDVNGDGRFDLIIRVEGPAALAEANFVL